jgi:hypothetical protein
VINSGDFITVAEGQAGLKFTPLPDSNAAGSFDVESSDDGTTVYSLSVPGTSTIAVTPVGDTPVAPGIVTLQDTQSGAIVLERHANDGAEVTHFRISNITGGTLFQADGVTVISSGGYITVAEGNAGLKFTPTTNSIAAGSFNVESSEDGATVAAQSSAATSTITVTPVEADPTHITIPPTPNADESPEPLNDSASSAEDADSPELDSNEPATPPMVMPSDSDAFSSGSRPQAATQPLEVTERTADVALPVSQVRGHGRATNDVPEESEPLEPAFVPLEALEVAPGTANDRGPIRIAGEAGIAQALDEVRDKADEDTADERLTLSKTTGMAASLSVGYLSWLLRGGVLLSSLLSSLPAWRFIDPLPVFAGRRRDEDEDDTDESLESIMKQGSKRSNAVRDQADDDAQPSRPNPADGADEHQ